MKTTSVLATAVLAITTSGFLGCNRNQSAENTNGTSDNRTAGEKTRDAVTNAGQKTGDALGTAVDKTKDAAQSAGQKMANATQPSMDAGMQKSRDTLANVVQSALTKDSLGDVEDQFTKADRQRIGNLDKSKQTDLNAAIEKFRADWKAKYNDDFKITDKKEMAFGAPVEVQFGQIDGARLAADKSNPSDANAQKSDANSPRVSFPANNGMPLVRVQLENEGMVTGSYKIDVPDTLDATKLHDNLLKHITQLDDAKASWPTDATEAYRTVAHHVFAALTDTQ